MSDNSRVSARCTYCVLENASAGVHPLELDAYGCCVLLSDEVSCRGVCNVGHMAHDSHAMARRVYSTLAARQLIQLQLYQIGFCDLWFCRFLSVF